MQGDGKPRLRIVGGGKKGSGGPRGPGRPPHEPTKDTRMLVSIAAAGGFTQAQIAELLGIGVTTLKENYKVELKGGAEKVNAMIVGNLARMAMSFTHPKAATCAIFWAKTRLGWKEMQIIPGEEAPEDGKEAPARQFTVTIGDKSGPALRV